MKKYSLSFLMLTCFLVFVTVVNIANAQEVNIYDDADGQEGGGGSSIPCYSTYTKCSILSSSCKVSVKCVSCVEQNMSSREDRGSCNNCGCN